MDARAAALSQRLRPVPLGQLDLNWTIDYPRSDRHLLEGVRRLTRIETRSVEQVVDLDGTDDVYNWPMMYAVEVGHWALPDNQAAQLREFLLRGGFLMVDDFHGDEPYHNVVERMAGVCRQHEQSFSGPPDCGPCELRPDLSHDLRSGRSLPGGRLAVVRAAAGRMKRARRERLRTGGRSYDDKGRVMVAICHNMDLGDAWEWSDDPRYPEKWASLAYRIAMNYFIYDLTH